MPSTYSLISGLLKEEVDTRFPIFFDASSVIQFREWAQNNQALYNELIERTESEKLKIIVFDSQLKKDRIKYQDNKKSLELMHFHIDEDYSWVSEYDPYATELQSIYFHDERNDIARNHAEFLVLSRYASSSHELRIITDNPTFSRVLNAQIYLLSKPGRLGLPPNINIFLDLEMHETLLKATSGFFYNGEYSTAVFEAAKELLEKLRYETNKKSDGTALINETLKIETHYDSKSGVSIKAGTSRPYYELNSLSTGDEISEQAAYYKFFLGLTELIRNTNAHNPATDPFIKRLFSDQKTVIKMLGFLSFLFEKVEKGTI